MPSDPRWLPIQAVIESNCTLVAITGERHFLRDRGLLESALARPQNAFAYGEEDILMLGVRLMLGIAQAHAFEQGNKRTAFTSLRLFLRANGYDLAVGDSEACAVAVIALIEHRSTEEDFAARLRPFVVER